jgi:hypothetical protein
MIVTVLSLAAAAALGYVYRQYRTRTAAQAAAGGSGASAFAKLAAADGKIIALKLATEAKLAEAKIRQDALDELHKILG